MTSLLPVARRAAQQLEERPRLVTVVDTEEEFDWNATYSRSNTSVSAMRHIHRAQEIFDRFGIKPAYLIDYPVASQPEGFEPLLEAWRGGRCAIGAHLHPWVNPPYEEALTRRNSFTSNLPEELQLAKLRTLSEAIESRFERPRVFKAGRYGIDTSTVKLLQHLEFDVDASVCPRHDFSAEEGPSFAAFDSTPFFLTSRILEIPCTVDYIGWAGPMRPTVHSRALAPRLQRLRAVGLLAKIGAVNRIMLSPEGNTLEEMRQLAKSLCDRGCRTLTLSFHSPSVEPGHTPYVRTRRDLEAFLGALDGFCEFFMTRLNGVAVTPLERYRELAMPSGQSI